MMDLSRYLNPGWSDLDDEQMWRMLHNNLVFVGSRSVLQEPDIKPETDYDFMAEWSFEMEAWLTKIGFDQKIMNIEYMDFATTQVWIHPFVNAQVVLKYPKHYLNCVKMWNVFKNNPVFFREYFWKSNPDETISRDLVRKRINAFLIFIGDSNV